MAPLDSLPTLDITKLATKQLNHAAKIFDEMCDLELLPIHQVDTDAVRSQVDERFGREVLDLRASLFAHDGVFELLRRKLAAEPSIRGNK